MSTEVKSFFCSRQPFVTRKAAFGFDFQTDILFQLLEGETHTSKCLLAFQSMKTWQEHNSIGKSITNELLLTANWKTILMYLRSLTIGSISSWPVHVPLSVHVWASALRLLDVVLLLLSRTWMILTSAKFDCHELPQEKKCRWGLSNPITFFFTFVIFLLVNEPVIGVSWWQQTRETSRGWRCWLTPRNWAAYWQTVVRFCLNFRPPA